VDADWANITQAWANLESKTLPQTETQPRLSAFAGLLEERRAEGKAQKVDVVRGGAIVHFIGGQMAVVYETYTNHSVAVNLATGEPLEPPPDDQEAVSYLLRKVDGVYKVAEFAHHDEVSSP
jgi:hypothetical protein